MSKQSKSKSGGGRWREVTVASPCPICGKPDWCSVVQGGGATVCRRVDHDGGEHRVDGAGVDFWLYRSDGAGAVEPPPMATANVARAADDDLDRVYRSILSLLPLSEQHRENLSRRGLTDDQIDAAGYRTLPIRGRHALAAKLVKEFGTKLCDGVPGLYAERDGRRSTWSLAGAAGLLIPARDAERRILAFKVRSDGAGNGSRYSYVSSKKHGGPGSGAPVHVPLFEHAGSRDVRVTEGELKADIATASSGILTLSVPGVSAWRRVLPVLKKAGTRSARLAFDADYATNENVGRALFASAEALVAEGLEVSLESWPAEHGKGIDDVLAAGHQPSLKRIGAVAPTNNVAADTEQPATTLEERLRELRRPPGED
jgi:hypothetical protein